LEEIQMSNSVSKNKFTFGQQVHHKVFKYYGVIIAVDPCYKGDDQWYEVVARSRPPKEKPWYHVKKTDGMETYVAERNLESNPATNN
jgi:heat shock protein HspQ